MSQLTKNPKNFFFDSSFIEGLTQIFEGSIPFNKLMGLKVVDIGPDYARASLAMRPELIGNYRHQRLHGGVISACLDTLGGLAVLAAVGYRQLNTPAFDCLSIFDKLGTVDLHVSYLRPSQGDHFQLHAQVMRLGKRLATTRMEFVDDQDRLLCTASGTYVVA